MSDDKQAVPTTTAITPWASVTLISLAAIVAGMYRVPCDCGCAGTPKLAAVAGCDCSPMKTVPQKRDAALPPAKPIGLGVEEK